MFAECLWDILTVELGIEFLVKVNTMSGDFQSINSSGFIGPLECVVIEEFSCSGVKMHAILSVFVSHKTELVPVSCLPNSRCVLVGKKAEIDIFAGEFELIHESAGIALINSNLLVSVDSNQGKSNLLNIDIMDSWMGKDVVSIERNALNIRVVKSTVSVNWEIVIFVPSVSDNETTGQIVATIGLKSENCSWNVLVCGFKDIVDN